MAKTHYGMYMYRSFTSGESCPVVISSQSDSVGAPVILILEWIMGAIGSGIGVRCREVRVSGILGPLWEIDSIGGCPAVGGPTGSTE
ncbi:hypothetical protein RJZ56_008018, partial [Blastomyces dermatitidis]